ncbi:phospho-N-acetylmuramoyl-pentapeptide-transferase [Actinotignum urinale]|uniref:Phospho-N-acetylmuramoyl-pentapeptide-transferase n=1 Tax=Actinotignum urinale TaxID=190146 RepID=A0AAW9HX06_9ACTO|nr:phospho-N-acetylmuramoyl-pentapeptide-transferase [Actinotignum urinale]MDY5129127.1 phospho-N-acetylmuramoyl-pentapeptide-transferase [Actinotignum urinale]MDY5132315.1 phospho-N-acetylmuramoyl-pentapeptide-transferase [Actinotignum urinale]MDY5151422.1 phospho-N-acetylmuramoyl-pentapeptide-transferase [Actinotignum urinale]MDY5154945.1 phospho-N-acetylmuramoyl-pentapeptide-transferase [Actinotignum urinale]MDY5160800.1 phospho-N-acetylmuramoyl-pentapeptide-transferase [Actinotignum urinal
MLALLVAFAVSLLATLAGTPLLIRVLVKKQFGQFIRQDGPTSHQTKRGTPTMGGLIIIFAVILAYVVANIVAKRIPGTSGILLLGLMVGMGGVGFADDFTKISKKQSLGLTPWAKIIGLGIVGISFSILSLLFPNENNLTPASTSLSFVRDTRISLAFAGTIVAVILFIIWSNFLLTAWSNAVNLTDGLDGLSTGASIIAFGVYTYITMWQTNHVCLGLIDAAPGCYAIRDPRDLNIIAVAMVGSLIGFLWWNTSPAQIFMGDTGSLAIGGVFAGFSIYTHTEFLAILIGGLYLLEVMSDVIQVGVFKLKRKRVFKMAPIHHHFELKGWKEVTVVVRFWIIQAMCGFLALGIFYGEWLTHR